MSEKENDNGTEESPVILTTYNETKLKALLKTIAYRAGCPGDVIGKLTLICPYPNKKCCDCWHEYLKG